MNITLLICRLLKLALNVVIVLLGFYELILLFQSLTRLRKLKNTIDILLGSKRKSRKVKADGPKQYSSQVTSELVLNWDEFDAFCEKYQEDSITISKFSLIIQLFPLLGILGTVAGLYYAMNSNQGIQNAQDMYDGVRLALSSTIYGILFAVFYKCLDVFINAYFINYIDDGIERFKDKYNEEKGIALGEDVK